MDGVTIRTNGEKARLPLAALPLIVCGVWGFLLVFRSLDGVSFRAFPVFLTGAAVPCLLWAGRRYGGRWFAPALLAALAALCLFAAPRWADGPGAQAGALLGHWFGDRIPALETWFGTAPPQSATALASVLAAALALSLFAAECLFRDHELPYTIATALLVYLPLLGLRGDVTAVFLLALFRLALRAAQNGAARAGPSLLPAGERTRLAGQSALVLCLLLSLSFLAADALAQHHAEALYAPVYSFERLMVRGIREAGDRIQAWRQAGGGLDGKIGAGNQYHFNTPQLELSASDLPTTPLYLRSFAGGDYTGGEWTDAEKVDEAVFQAIQPDMMPEDPVSWNASAKRWFSGMYYELNQAQTDWIFGSLLSSQSSPETERAAGMVSAFPRFSPRSLILRNLGKSDISTYTPYYSYPMPGHMANPGQSPYLSVPPPGNAYGFLYYQQDEMRLDWDLLSEIKHGAASWYRNLQNAYFKEAQRAYTRVPEEEIPRLAALVRENPLTDLDEITAFILHTLHSRAAYSLTPGWSPGGRDVVEDFLFEKGKGYCQHFAAAAALMYRLYGVPARYAAGYVALPNAFAPVFEDGGAASGGTGGGIASDTAVPDGAAEEEAPASWHAKLTDSSAHAWVEIFLDGCGWTPVEVTPASADSAAGPRAAASYPGFNPEVQAEIAREHGWTGPQQAYKSGSVSGGTDGADSENGTDDSGTGSGETSADSEPSGQAEPPDGSGEQEGRPNDGQPSTLRRDGGIVNHAVFFLFAALLLTPPAFVGRRKRILARMEAMDSREALYRMGELLRFAGTPVDEEAEDYAARLAQAVPALTAGEAAWLAGAASRAAFGQRPPEEAENASARALYFRAAGWVYGTLDWRRRLAFRWREALG